MADRVEADRSGRSYERLVGRAMRTLFRLEESGGSVARNVVLKGASGAGHEIDLLLGIPYRGKILHAAVECKDHARPVGMEKVAAFGMVLKDLNGLRGPEDRLAGILVSGSGYQSGAVEMAGHTGIRLLEIRKPDDREWRQYIRMILREEQKGDLRGRGASGLEVSLRANGHIRVETDLDRVAEHGLPPWRMETPLARDPDSLMLSGKTLSEMIQEIPHRDGVVHRRVVRKVPGGTLRHMVWDGEMPVKSVTFSFDDLTEDLKDTILYGREKPFLIISDPACRWRAGIWNGKAERLPDLIGEIRERR